MSRAAVVQAFARVLAGPRVKQVIVRSSAVEEDQVDHLFPGVLRSVGGVSSEDELWNAIEACLSARSSQRFLEYCKLFGVEPGRVRLSLLVQAEVLPQLSGVLLTAVVEGVGAEHGYQIEARVGPSRDMLAGGEVGVSVLLDPDRGHDPVFLSGDEEARQLVLRHWIGIAELGNLAIEVLGSSTLEIEWAVADSLLYALQARPLSLLPRSGPAKEV